MKLLRDCVLLQPLKPAEVSPGGIHYARPYLDDCTQYTVLAVGPGKLRNGARIPPEVRPGDRCLCHANRGNLHTFEDGRIIVRADQIEMVWPGPK